MGSSDSGGINPEIAQIEEEIAQREAIITAEKSKIIQLNRCKNYLSSPSIRAPPEILGYIFELAIEREQHLHSGIHFDELEGGRCNFLLVCHHWFQVASNIPKLWNFREISLHNGETTPGVLALDLYKPQTGRVNLPLRDELKNHITQDNIRSIDLQGRDPSSLGSILSLLTPNEDGVQEKRIESFIFQTPKDIPMELSNFFAQLHLPFLQRLCIRGVLNTPLWDSLNLKTTHLTVLSLQLPETQFSLTMPQLLLILIANPNLQDLSLREVPCDEVENTGVQVPLLHLKTIDLEGELTDIFQLLEQLQIPAMLDRTSLTMTETTFPDIISTMVPYMKNLFQHDLRFKESTSVTSGSVGSDIRIPITVCHESPTQEQQSSKIMLNLPYPHPPTSPQLQVLPINPMEDIPQKHWEFLKATCAPEIQEELYEAKFELKFVSEDGWQPLIAYLENQLPNDQPIKLSLCMTSQFNMIEDTTLSIEKQVGFSHDNVDHYFNDHDYYDDDYGYENGYRTD